MPLKRLGLSLETSFISIYKPLLNFALLFKLLADAAQKLECCITSFPLEFREESCEKCQHTPPPNQIFSQYIGSSFYPKWVFHKRIVASS